MFRCECCNVDVKLTKRSYKENVSRNGLFIKLAIGFLMVLLNRLIGMLIRMVMLCIRKHYGIMRNH
jgi:hypothetical protein